MVLRRVTYVLLLATLSWTYSSTASAQSLGIELHNVLMPKSGGMGGASLASPLDPQSAVAGNPAALTQFRGTQFSFGGGWIESTYNVSHTGGSGLPNLGAFSAKSEAEGSALGNIAVTQDWRALGLPVTTGIGLLSGAGAGLSFRDVPESNGTSVTISILHIGTTVGVELTDRLSAGAGLYLGSSTLDGIFQGIGSAAYAYKLRGSLGLNYELTERSRLGFMYQTRQNFNFDDAIRIDLGGGAYQAIQDIDAGLPENLGLGYSNSHLMDGRLLIAADVLYKQWDTADLFNVLYQNQWVFQLGTQYAATQRVRLRAGYVYAENPIDQTIGTTPPGGVDPAGPLVAAVQYLQSTVAVTNQHRVSGGVGVQDLLPGLDFDLFAGGMFGDFEQLGQFTSTDVASYYLGAGMTWRFGRGSCCDLGIPDQW